MYKNNKILCVIPARGGSKRLPGKNLKLLNGVPLIGYAISVAKGSQYIDKIVVSTDDKEIVRVAREHGADVPFMRPAELASDTATTLSVLQHAVSFLEEKGEQFDLVVTVQPTVPGVETKDIDSAIEKLVSSGANSCISICEIVDRPEWMYLLVENGMITPYADVSIAPGQSTEKLYRVSGAVYVTTRETMIEKNLIVDNGNCAAVVVPRKRSTDIDTEFDFVMAETLMKSAGTSSA